MAVESDKNPMAIVVPTIVKDAAEKVGKVIKKKMEEDTILVDPCPSSGLKIIKAFDKLKKKLSK